MDGKKTMGVRVATESAAQAELRRGGARNLAPDEEKVMRMRLGASLPLSARLERLAVASDAEIEILAYEIEAYLHLKARRSAATPATGATVVAAPVPSPSRTKEKIIRALRRKT